jgi:hypothetical protein
MDGRGSGNNTPPTNRKANYGRVPRLDGSPRTRACPGLGGHDPQGSRTRPGPHAVARCAGLSRPRWARPQGSRIRPGLHAVARCAGLSRRRWARPQGSGTRLGQHAVARCAGLSAHRWARRHGLRTRPWATRCRPLRGLVLPHTESADLQHQPTALCFRFLPQLT